MNNPEGILCAITIILCVIMLYYYIKSRNKLGRFILGVGSGIACLFPASYIVTACGGALSLNLFTFSFAGILGIPGVILLSAAVLI